MMAEALQECLSRFPKKKTKISSLRKDPFLHALRRWGRFALLQSHFASALSEFAALNPFKRVQILKVNTIL